MNQDTPTRKTCPSCGRGLSEAETAFCGGCGAALTGARPMPPAPPLPTFTHLGSQWALGYTPSEYGIWDRQSGAPAHSYERTDAGWKQAWDQYSRMERALALSRVGHRVGRALALIVIAVVIAGYIILHNLRYADCLMQPGLFSWPSVCI